MAKVIWSKRASGQLEHNIKYIKDEQGISYAETVLSKILSPTTLLGKTPKMGRIEPLLAYKKTEYRFIFVWEL